MVKSKIKGILLITFICLMIVFYGFIVISGSLPKFIKDRSALKINYNLSPFDFTVDINDYSLYVNQKVFINVKNGSVRLFNNIESSIHNSVNSVMNRTSQVYKSMEDQIREVFQNRVK
ncbi:hypothetical protein [Clostridium sp. DJ247]|uniref:hypothetical protein n=1 Tax=Clostridium sp. DJ247 TaxID=2726188 RepID=UPI001625DB11|nr:hypothetical protein [Clostridium sp. DJ247]MBC2579257.1 hypothetical protein [Clostridium sp. DJ247]MBC2579292.1 hypothetical protein [Clostridium sp. DJ247]